MIEYIGQKIINETNLMVDDKPYYFKDFLSNAKDFVNWNDIESCINRPELFNFELIDKNTNLKIGIPESMKSWVFDRKVQEKRFIFEKLSQGHGLVIMNYGFYNKNTIRLLETFEKLFDVNSAIHVYCGLEGSASFPIHDDYPVNFIIQVEGKTRWKIFDNRISYLYKIGTLNDQMKDGKLDESLLRTAIDVVLEPGDGLYIPSRCYHVAFPSEKRISMSIPCWIKYPKDPVDQTSDRNWYKINKE